MSDISAVIATDVAVGDFISYGLQWMQVARIDVDPGGRLRFRGEVMRAGVPRSVTEDCDPDELVTTLRFGPA